MTKRLAVPFAALLITCSSPPPPPNTLAPDPPTFQKATPVEGGTRLSWKTAAAVDEDWDLTLVIRYPGKPDGRPGTSVPSRGETLGSGLVVYVGPAVELLDSELPGDCSTFTYQLWSHDKAGHWSGGGVTATTLPGGLAPPAAPPSAFTATRTATQLQLSWAPSAGSTSTRVVRNLGTPPLSPEQGTTVYAGPASMATESLSALPIGQTLFYGAFACNSCAACSPLAAMTTAIIDREDGGLPDAGPDDPDGGSPLQPQMMSAGVPATGTNVVINWTNPPASTGFTQVKVLRQLNALPAGPDDPNAETVFTGFATSTSESVTRLLPNAPGTHRTYFYVAYGCAGSVCETRGARSLFQLTVSEALRGGGYTIWWRHASASTCGDRTDLGACSCSNGVCTNCPANNWWKSCDTNCTTATARQLTPPNSTAETQTIHDQFAMKRFTVGRVLSSEMCRGIQTAQGMNFGPSIEQLKELTYFVYDEANRCTNTYNLLNEAPAAGTNTAMVSHAGFACPTIDSLAWGEAAIFKPNPGGSPTFITRVAWNQWAALP
jgi:hypothetical protein